MFFNATFTDFRLDVVGLLAILGESSITATAQVCSLSILSLLPRLLPAPHAFLAFDRARSLPTEPGKVIGIRSGNIRDAIRYFPHMLHTQGKLKELGPNCVRCLCITIVDDKRKVRPASLSILNFVEVGACLISVALLVLAIVYRDGWALVANAMLSGLSSIIGFTHFWDPSCEFEPYDQKRVVPPGDLVVYYPKGAFYIIKCDEKVARELYLPADQDVKYRLDDSYVYRGFLQLGTLMLMIGVIALGNAQLILQTAFGASYLLLNTVYWTAGAGPASRHWDLSRYAVSAVQWQNTDPSKDGVCEESNFTMTLWRAISMAGDAHWAREGQIAPSNAKWDAWLALAQKQVDLHQAQTPVNAASAMPPSDKLKLGLVPQLASLPQWPDGISEKGELVLGPQFALSAAFKDGSIPLFQPL